MKFVHKLYDVRYTKHGRRNGRMQEWTASMPSVLCGADTKGQVNRRDDTKVTCPECLKRMRANLRKYGTTEPRRGLSMGIF